MRAEYDQTGVVVVDGVRRYADVPGTLGRLLVAQVERSGDNVAVRDPNGSLTYRELLARASRVAGGLHASGCRPGDRVALRRSNGVDWVLAYWGIVLAGCVVVPIGAHYPSGEIDYLRADSGARVEISEQQLPDAEPWIAQSVCPEDLACLFYTSGTTGRPKGAMITHDNATQNAETTRRLYDAALAGASVDSLVVVPLSHITGCNSQMVTTIHAGGTLTVLPGFDIQSFRDSVREGQASVVVGVPTIFRRILQDPAFDPADYAGIKALCYGGAPTPTDLVRRIKDGFPGALVQNAFGSTECTGLHTALPDAYAISRSASVGVPMPISEVRIDRPDEHGVGEVLVRGANVFAGYWQRPEKTAEAFTADGWFRMGDLGRLDDDFLTVVDRLKDVVIRGGLKVFSGEVESVLAAAPNVGEVAVVGVPDEDLGERVGVALSSVDGTSIDVTAVLDHAAEHLARYKIPELFHVSEAPLPRNAGGKIVKSALRATVDWSALEPVRRSAVEQ